MKTSQRMEAIQTPIIPIIGQLIKDNPGTISLAQGVVYYPPPQEVIDKASDFGSDLADHRYAPVQGMPSLIKAISKKLQSENGVSGDLGNRIIVTAGANMGFLNALFAITDPGDQIILPTPYYFNQEMAIRMLNCEPVLVKTDSEFQLDVEKLAAAINDKTRAIVTISPNNPSGVVYPKTDLEAVNRLCRERGIYHICDEAYEYFTYNQAEHFSPSSLDTSHDQTISLYSLSKAFGFASWRIGYMLIPEPLYKPIIKAQDSNLICASQIAQYAALEAIQIGAAYPRQKLAKLSETRELVLEKLQSLQDICSFPNSNGAFYFLLKVDTSLDSMMLVKTLIEDYRVAVLPGQAFGLDQGCYIRVSYGALESESAIKGISRLTQGLLALC